MGGEPVHTVMDSQSAQADLDNTDMTVTASPAMRGSAAHESHDTLADEPAAAGTRVDLGDQVSDRGGAEGRVVDALDSGAAGDDNGGITADPGGEPPGNAARPTDVTQTLAVSADTPGMTFGTAAPQSPASETRPPATTWDAADVVTEIYHGHYSQLVRLAILLVHDVPTAEEVVQDAFEAMHLAWRRLRDSDKALQYLRQSVVNRSRSVLRHRKVVDMHAPKPAPDEPSAEQAALVLIERSAVAAALRTLPERQREAIVLRYYSDLSEADIAKAMGISRGAVKSHTARAMAALKTILTQES